MHRFFIEKGLFLLIPILFFWLADINAQEQIDKLQLEKIIDAPIKAYVYTPSNLVWAIAGEQNNKIVRIKKKQNVREYFFQQKYPNIYFTTLYSLPNGNIIAGTKDNYLFYIQGKSSTIIDQNNGLLDSTILKIYFNPSTKNIEFTTPSRAYKIENATSLRRIRCVPIEEDESLFESITYSLRTYIQKPIQKGISTIASEFDYSFRSKKYIGIAEYDSIVKLLRPGDVLLKRDNYFLSNVGIEGFWTHSAIYIGSLEDLDKQFSGISMINQEQPSTYLLKNHPLIYQLIEGKKHLIIEAIGKGVSVNSLEHIALVDYFSAIRPNLTKEDIFKSMLISFEYIGVPYDFLFDFRSDNEVVCSELVYNSYRLKSDKNGINFLFSKVMGNPFVSPNDIAHLYAQEQSSQNPSFYFVVFCDFDEQTSKSFFNSADAFANSWKRKGM
jgi:hypothetical protein